MARKRISGARSRNMQNDAATKSAVWENGAKAQGPHAELLQLQRLGGNRLVRKMMDSSLGLTIQRDITVTDPAKSGTPGYWANEYLVEHDNTADYGRTMDAFKRLEDQTFDSRGALYDRVAVLLVEGANRARQPLGKETSAFLVALEIDNYFDEIKELPKLILNRTYESNWDKNGGFGSEHLDPTSEKNWVLHVHRGKKGGMKTASIKKYSERKEKEASVRMFKVENVQKLGVPQTDATRRDEE